jgi:hypothetical protein
MFASDFILLSLFDLPNYGAWWGVFIVGAWLAAFFGGVPGVLLWWLVTAGLVYTQDFAQANLAQHFAADHDYEFKLPFYYVLHLFWIVLLTLPFSALGLCLRRRRRASLFVALLAALALPAAPRLSAGSLAGYVRDLNWFAQYESNPFGVGYYEFALNANAANNASLGGVVATDVYGRFQMNGLPAGAYTVATWDVWWRSAYAFAVNVPASGTSATVDMRLKATMWGYPAFWDDAGYYEFGQTFAASGPVSMIYLRDPLSTAFTRTVTVHAGGPGGAQIGRTRTYGSGGDQRLIYGYGDMPTIEGQTYYLRLRTPAPATGAVIMQMDPRPDFSDPMPGGCLYLGNGTTLTPYPDRDLGVVLMADDDGLITDLFARASGSAWSGVTSVGQTFTARGVNLIGVAFWLADPTAPTYAVRLLETGPGGAPVGTTKRGKPARLSADPEMLVAWAPGECPLTPGQLYYLEVTRDGGGTFNAVYVNAANPYPHGQAFRNGVAVSGTDLAGTIMEEESPGSATQRALRFASEPTVPEARRGANEVTIQWQTDLAADSLIECAVEHPPYTLSYSAPEAATAHSLRLTGLQPHTLYHFRVTSAHPDSRAAVSRDMVFCTKPAAANLLVNPGFEEGTGSGPARPVTGWVPTGSVDIKAANNGWFWGLEPHSGSWLLQGAVNGTSSDGAIQQQVRGVVPGQEYTFSAWVMTAMRENNTWKYDVWNERNRLIVMRLGLDPTGDTNPSSPAVRWTPRFYSHRHYTLLAKSVVAQSTNLTVFVSMKGTGGQWHLYALDDCALTREDIPLRLTGAGCTNDVFQTTVLSRANRTNVIEVSTNLTDWRTVTNLLNATGTVTFAEPVTTNAGPRFFRARVLPLP